MGTTRQKLRKLIRDPQRFISDFVDKRTPARFQFFPSRLRKTPVAFFEKMGKTYDNFSFESMLGELSCRLPVLLSISEKSYALGFLEGHLFSALESIRSFGRSFGLRPYIEVRGRIFFLDSYLSEELMLVLRSASWFRCHLRHSRLSASVLAVDIYVYRQTNGLYRNSSPSVQLRSIPAKTAAKLITGASGIWTTADILSGSISNSQPKDPVDLVYTWVNSSDENWQRMHSEFCGGSIDQDRYRSRNELRYSLRSAHYHCGWFRKIHIVSNCAPPSWLDTEHESIHWVDHSEILDNEFLPTFNSHAIEAGLYRIPDLADRFIYFNDDVFATRPIRTSLFFDALGRTSSFLESVGMISPESIVDEESWFHSRVYAQKLLLEELGTAATTMHHHVPFAIRRTHYQAMLEQFGTVTKNVESNRQRTNEDIPLIAFLYPHYSLAVGRGRSESIECQTLDNGNFESFSLREQSLFLCINDGKGTGSCRDFDKVATRLMESRFPIAGPWEK